MSFLQNWTQSKNFKKTVIGTFLLLSALFWLGMWIYGKFYISTDNAYVNANIVQIAPRISGKVTNLYVVNNQYVKKDQPLFDIDPEPYQAVVDAAKADVAVSQALADKAELTTKRIIDLVKHKYSSPQDYDNAIAELKTAKAQLLRANASFQQAQLNLRYTVLTAPTSGWVTNVSLRVGNIVTANQPLFALISDQEFWVDANFKETEMERIKPGQKATVVVDLYPDHVFDAVVESISGGAGAAFSLLPPQNATGNWVKVTQRIPVRIHILNPDLNYPLRVGTSATATVYLKEFLKLPAH